MRKLLLTVLITVTLAPSAAQASSGWAKYSPGVFVHWHSHVSQPTTESITAWLRYTEARHRAIVRARHAHAAWLEQRRAIVAQERSQAQHGASSPGGGYSGSVPNLIRSIWGSAAGCALAIAWRESRFNPRAYNPSGAAGLFQLMPIWYRGHWHFDPFSAYLNTLYAHRLYLMAGYSPWGGCPSG